MSALNGLKVEREIQISDGIKLIPLSNSIGDIEYYPFCGVFISSIYELGPRSLFVGKTPLIIDYHVCPAFSKPYDVLSSDSPFQIKVKNEEFKEVNINNLCMVLSLVSDSAVESFLTWDHFGADDLFGYDSPFIPDQPASIKTEPQFNIISEDQAKQAKELYKAVFSLESKVQERILMAIYRWIESKTNKGLAEKMADLGVAFESLYLDVGNRGPLSLSFAIRAAWHLGKNAEDRKYLMELCRKIYHFRSKAVHEGKISEESMAIEIEGRKIFLMEEAQNLCCEAIIRVIKEGKFPNWNSLIVGGDAT